MWKKLFGDKKEFQIPGKDSPLFRSIDWEKIPRHVAIIMDGNGRWAKEKGLPRTAGHTAGVKVLKNILKTALGLRIEALTVYAFSTENWKRPRPEVDFLMKLFSEYLMKELMEMHRDGVHIRFIGRPDELSQTLRQQMREAEELMKNNTGITFNVAMNYGGRDEILRATRALGERVKSGELAPADIDEETFEDSLDTAGESPVDLLIRTSGDIRISNFLLWQTAYAELYFTKRNWPEFRPEDFVKAIKSFGERERRFGGLSAEAPE